MPHRPHVVSLIEAPIYKSHNPFLNVADNAFTFFSMRKGLSVVPTLQTRRGLEDAMGSDMGTIVDPISKKRRTLSELLAETKNFDAILSRTPNMGHGSFGQVRRLSDNVVVKAIEVNPNALGCGPFRSETNEYRLVQYLWKHMHTITPHIIMPLGSHAIIQEKSVYFMEYVKGGTLYQFLKKERQNVPNLDHYLRAFLFHICYTLEAIYARWPNFRHNDLKDDNILLHPSKTDGYIHYSINDTNYYVPNVGYMAVICDFDYSCIAGQGFDNYKVVERNIESPTFNMNGYKDQAADIYCLITYLRHHFEKYLSRGFRDELNHLFGVHTLQNRWRLYPFTQDACPVRNVLSYLFQSFIKKQDQITDFYCADVIVKPEPVVIPKSSERLFCPIFVAPGATRDYLSKLMPAFVTTATNFTPATSTQMHSLTELFEDLYEWDLEQKQDFFDDCCDATLQFINRTRLPIRWWYISYIANFIRTAQQMHLYRYDDNKNDEQNSQMMIEDWVIYLKKKCNIDFGEMELLHFMMQF